MIRTGKITINNLHYDCPGDATAQQAFSLYLPLSHQIVSFKQ